MVQANFPPWYVNRAHTHLLSLPALYPSSKIIQIVMFIVGFMCLTLLEIVTRRKLISLF